MKKICVFVCTILLLSMSIALTACTDTKKDTAPETTPTTTTTATSASYTDQDLADMILQDYVTKEKAAGYDLQMGVDLSDSDTPDTFIVQVYESLADKNTVYQTYDVNRVTLQAVPEFPSAADGTLDLNTLLNAG